MAIRILTEGLARPASKGDVEHRQAYSISHQSIYLSPSIEDVRHLQQSSIFYVDAARVRDFRRGSHEEDARKQGLRYLLFPLYL